MRIYETTFILTPQADDAAFDRQIKSVTDLITRYRGKVLDEDRWGVRRLAYPVKKFTQGYYARIVFEGNGTLLSELDRFFRIEEPYIRHLTVLFEGKLEEKPRDEKAVDLMVEPEPAKKPESFGQPEAEEPTPASESEASPDSIPTEPTDKPEEAEL